MREPTSMSEPVEVKRSERLSTRRERTGQSEYRIVALIYVAADDLAAAERVVHRKLKAEDRIGRSQITDVLLTATQRVRDSDERLDWAKMMGGQPGQQP